MNRIIDWLGQEIEPNSLVLYTTRSGSSATELRFGRVVTLGIDDEYTSDDQVLVQWIKTSKYSLPDAAETWVRKDKLTVMPKEMADLL